MHPAINKVHVNHRGRVVPVYYLAMRDENDNGEAVFWWPSRGGRGQEESDSILDSPWYTDDQQEAERKAIELFGEGMGRKLLKAARSLIDRMLS